MDNVWTVAGTHFIPPPTTTPQIITSTHRHVHSLLIYNSTYLQLAIDLSCTHTNSLPFTHTTTVGHPTSVAYVARLLQGGPGETKAGGTLAVYLRGPPLMHYSERRLACVYVCMWGCVRVLCTLLSFVDLIKKHRIRPIDRIPTLRP